MSSAKIYDLVIIGSGPGGHVAALYASRHKLSVCVIEKELTGGTCLNKGCIPTKALLQSASILSKIKNSKEFGIEVNDFKVDFSAVVSRKDIIVSRLRAGIEALLKANHIDLIKGAARLKAGGAVTVNGQDINARSIIIAVGSRPFGLPGIKMDEIDICSSDGVLNFKELPGSIAIVGGGVIGCEFASLFNSLGSKVFIVELMDRILPTQSREVSKKMELLLKKRGVDIYTSTKLGSVVKDGGVKLELAGGQTIAAQKALISVGRSPNTGELGLEETGVGLEKGKILVDKGLRTSVKNIYAIGDCVSGPLLAHKASYDGIVAVDNILGVPREADYSNIPNCVWTDPEVASVGLTEEEAKAKYPDARSVKFSYLASGKAAVIGKTEGFIKLIGDTSGKILGIEIFGEEACDLIGEGVLARDKGVSIKDLGRVVHGHPTLSEIYQGAAEAWC